MKIKNIGIAAKYTSIVLAGCAVTVSAAETISSHGKNNVPVLAASNSTVFSSSTKHNVTDTLVSTSSPPSFSSISTASSSAPLSSAQSSTSVSSPVTSEPTEASVNSSADMFATTESSSEPTPAPVQSSEYPWELTDVDWSMFLQTDLEDISPPTEITSFSTSADSSTSKMSASEPTVASSSEPPIQSTELPIQSDETTASSVEPPEPVVPDFSESVIVNINIATVEELTRLDGIGEDKALAIIEFRERFGGFTSIYEIREVDGIGDSVFERIRDFIVI